MEREISNIMVTDDVVRDAITRNDGVTMCTCSGVDVSGDLQVVKVYIVVQSRDERARYAITKRLQGLTGYIRRLIGQRVQLRLTPEIRILYDDAAERGERVLQLLDSIKEEDEKKAALKRQAAGEDAEEEEEEEEEGFLDLDEEASSEDAAEASGGDKKKRKGGGTKPNPFLEGVGDPDYDSDAERPGGERPPLLLTPNMFPDAYPELDEMQAREKQSAWQRKQDGKKGGKYRIRRKHGS